MPPLRARPATLYDPFGPPHSTLAESLDISPSTATMGRLTSRGHPPTSQDLDLRGVKTSTENVTETLASVLLRVRELEQVSPLTILQLSNRQLFSSGDSRDRRTSVLQTN